MKLTTPETINENVLRLRDRIGVTTEPIFVSVQPGTRGKLNDCFADVARKVARDAGSVQHGWTVWEAPGVMIEGEFHAVWAAPDGTLLDVTPKADGEKKILFIPDPERIYRNAHVDNVRVPLSDDPAIHRMIAMNEELAELRRKYNDGTGTAKIPVQEIEAVQKKYRLPPEAQYRAEPRVGRNEPCPCGSGKKFKRCHGKP